jgi:hypothetical protein
MRIQHLPPERVPRSGVLKGSFILLRYSVAPNLFCSTLDSITVPKSKKSSTPSTMTALHVVLPPPAPRNVNVSLSGPRTSTFIPPLHHRTQLITSMAPSLHHTALPFPCCLLSIRFVPVTPSRFISYPNARNTSSMMSVSSFNPFARLLYYHPCLHCSYYNE